MKLTKFSFSMGLYDNPKNREKAECMSAFEVMMDDRNNPLPEEWYETIAGDAGVELPWGSKVKIIVEFENGITANQD